ncbi:hypothetical protein PUNSTDRAFT_50612 [Punctularia strigosozonata HHB-11173 SS5]|uniref:uncharacterized protein n=1 Tax=Punctularia strigosozonata (strain HHB-11173) TaxID=741275 RepID=UPI0004417B57|nr:uncharacterized protein PUNSTDRAFT_50612 [Punctularia strigosozonata HHB-11173 SS5]EIN11727.1 hypothetical protein PUNSTDRAFT_50612 [Punctularia strigosozonata HHB-11173 SS5]
MMSSRLSIRSAVRIGSRRTPVHARFQSTTASSGTAGSHVAAGVAGGGVVLLGGYTYYHFSSLKTAVQTAQSAQDYIRDTSNRVASTVSEHAKNPSKALQKLRQVAHSYVALIPGAAAYVDSTFDVFDQVAETHGDEADRIASEAYAEIEKVIKEKGGPTNVDAAAAWKIVDVLRRKMAELGELAKSAGQSAIGPILDKHPELRDKIGGGYEQLRALAESQGGEAKKILDDTTKQLQEIFSKGFSTDAVNQARELLQSKSQEVRKIAEPATQEAWKKAVEQAKPYLDKAPEIRDLLNENANKFTGAGIAYLQGHGMGELWDRVKDAANGDKHKQEELKNFILDKAKEAAEKGEQSVGGGVEGILDLVKLVPGGQELLEKSPNIKVLAEITQSRSEQAQKLAQETYRDILKVLDDKAKKAKDLGEGAKKEAKEKA